MKEDITTSERTTGYKILHSAIVKILIGLLLVAGIVTALQSFLKKLLESSSLSSDYTNLLIGIAVALISLACYAGLYKIYEKRHITELSTQRLIRNLSLGLILGFGLQTLTIGVIWISAGYKVLAINSIGFILPPLTMALTSAIFEEILFRGILFRILEEKLGSYLALAISALIFGGMHLMNPNSSLIAATGMAIQAGLLLGAVFIFSRNLWLPIALHFAWNFTQSGIYGASTSGNKISRSLISSEISGPELITGGQFGPEGSLQATLFCLSAAIIVLILCSKQNKIVQPSWKKTNE